jgi:RNA polymerase sigma factor (sigma-70 family)
VAEQASLHSLAPRSDETEDRFALVEALKQGLATLTETQRKCLFLVRCQSRSSSEVADLLHTTPTAVRMHIHRARARLRQQLE